MKNKKSLTELESFFLEQSSKEKEVSLLKIIFSRHSNKKNLVEPVNLPSNGSHGAPDFDFAQKIKGCIHPCKINVKSKDLSDINYDLMYDKKKECWIYCSDGEKFPRLIRDTKDLNSEGN